MTVVWTEFVYPLGKLRADQFPNDDLATVVSAWLDEAGGKVVDIDATLVDEATRDWVYYRAFSSIADRLALEPDEVTADGMSRSISNERIQHFRNLAASHLEQFRAASPAVELPAHRTTGVITSVRF